MGKEYIEGWGILKRIKDFYETHGFNSDADCKYAQSIHWALTGGGYDTPIAEREMAKWLEKAFRKGKRIKEELDCEFLSGEELESYLKKHPQHKWKAGSRATQCDGWSHHCIIDEDSSFNPELGF